MKSIFDAIKEVEKKGLPIDDFELLPNNQKEAIILVRQLLARHPAVSFLEDTPILSITTPNKGAVRKTPDAEIKKMLSSFNGRPILARGSDPNAIRQFGVITASREGQVVLDVLQAEPEISKAVKTYRDLTRGKKAATHSLVLEPGHAWKTIENAPSGPNAIDTDLDAARKLLMHFKENDYLNAFHELSKKFGHFSLSFKIYKNGETRFFHPLAANYRRRF